MGGEGSIQHMINSLKNNKKLLRRKKAFQKDNSTTLSKTALSSKFRAKKASPELIHRIRRESKRRRIKWIILYIIISTFVIASVSYVVYNFNQDVINDKKLRFKENKERIKRKNQERLQISIEEGNEFFKKEKWSQAIEQYYNAYQLAPDQFNIEFRLVETMCLNCDENYDGCREAKRFLDNLYQKYPEKKEKLDELKSYLKYEY
jgi:cytochrome c-type biogenesis protein CcmH/NrfG